MVVEFETELCTMKHTSWKEVFLGRREKYFNSWLENLRKLVVAVTHHDPFCKFTCPFRWC